LTMYLFLLIVFSTPNGEVRIMSDIIEKLFELFGESPDLAKFDEVAALFKEEAIKRRKAREVEAMKAVISSRGASFARKLPMFAELFGGKLDVDRIAAIAAEYLYSSTTGELLPPLLPVMGSAHKRYPIRGLLKAGGVTSPEVPPIEEAHNHPRTCYLGVPYIVFGVDALVAEDITPQEADKMLWLERGSPFNLDKAAAIFLQDDTDLAPAPYSILVMGVTSEKQYFVIKVDAEGKKTLVLVSRKEKIAGRVIIPTYMGEEGLDFY